MPNGFQELISVLVAIGLGGLIGIEREYRDKAAGFRTIILICVGAAMFTAWSMRFAGWGDPSRVASGVVTGVGFLGAGVIIRNRGRVRGLTTAATVWVAAALGTGIGLRLYLEAVLCTGAILAVLWFLPAVERSIGRRRIKVLYEIICPVGQQHIRALREHFLESGLRILRQESSQRDDEMLCVVFALGSYKAHEELSARLLGDRAVRSFSTGG